MSPPRPSPELLERLREDKRRLHAAARALPPEEKVRRVIELQRIVLPLIRPGLFAGCTLVLIWSFTELGTPLMFDFYTITPVQLFHQITDVADNPLPYALVVVMLIASSVLYLIGKVLLGRS